MSYFSVLGVLSNVQIWFHTKLHGTPVGQDDFGNKYYTQKARKGQKRERRWVIYAQKTEASSVPALWHGWLHHQTNHLPTGVSPYQKTWQKQHLSNQTGFPTAYLPPGHQAGKAKRDKATGDYTAWQPD